MCVPWFMLECWMVAVQRNPWKICFVWCHCIQSTRRMHYVYCALLMVGAASSVRRTSATSSGHSLVYLLVGRAFTRINYTPSTTRVNRKVSVRGGTRLSISQTGGGSSSSFTWLTVKSASSFSSMEAFLPILQGLAGFSRMGMITIRLLSVATQT